MCIIFHASIATPPAFTFTRNQQNLIPVLPKGTYIPKMLKNDFKYQK